MQLGVIAEGLGMKVIYFDVESKLPLTQGNPVQSSGGRSYCELARASARQHGALDGQ